MNIATKSAVQDSIKKKKVWTWELGGVGREKPSSEAIERASDIPPSLLIGFLPTHVGFDSLPIIAFGFGLGFGFASLSLFTHNVYQLQIF